MEAVIVAAIAAVPLVLTGWWSYKARADVKTGNGRTIGQYAVDTNALLTQHILNDEEFQKKVEKRLERLES